jgi:hypothetical protein
LKSAGDCAGKFKKALGDQEVEVMLPKAKKDLIFFLIGIFLTLKKL